MHSRCPWLRVGRRTAAAAALAVLLAGCGVGASSLDEEEEASSSVPFYTEETSSKAEALAAALAPPSAQNLRSWKDLAPSVQEGLRHARAREPEQVAVAHEDVAVTWGDVEASLTRLSELLPRLDAEPELLGREFRWIRLTEGASFSGYYEPVVMASRTKKPGFERALYRLPPDLKQLDLGAFRPMLTGQRIAYRTVDGVAVPYYSRAEIDGDGVLRGKKLELAWVDPVDAYFLQIQGSGRLRFEDGSEKAFLYAGSNGLPYLSVGRRLAELGAIPPESLSMQSVRQWLKDHPEERENLLRLNERYVFFREEAPASGPVGGMGVPITPLVTLAVDRETFPLGSLLAFSVPLPDPDAPLSENGAAAVSTLAGLGFAQDTGEAIRGRRVDLFCGEGERAAFVAGRLNAPGEAWLLLAK